MRRFGWAVLAVLALLSGCKEEKKAAPSASVLDRAREATERNIRIGAPPDMKFRGMQVYAQANAQRVAVCGQLDPFADNPDVYVPFVSIVTLPANPDDRTASYQFEHHIGTNTSEATRVYAALVTYCYDQGGPVPGPARNVAPPPPMPDAIPDPSPQSHLTIQTPAAPPGAGPLTVTTRATPPAPTAPAPAAPVADQTPATGTVIMRQAANVHSDPHGPTVRVAPQGMSLHVFAQATGGWYEIGDTAPWGWVHESMLEKH